MIDRQIDSPIPMPRRYLTPIECMSKGNFQFRPLHPIFGSAGPAEHTRPPRQGLKLLRRAAVPRAGSKGAPMKLPRTVGLAVAVSLVAATVAALA